MRVLVAAATRHEATLEIAEAIASGLTARGLDAEARRIDAPTDLDGVDAAVIGSAVYMGRWLGPARRFIETNASEFVRMPVWLFSSGPLGPPDHLIPPGVPADAPVMVSLTHVRAHRVFAGRLTKEGLSVAERVTAHIVHAAAADYRDWAAIDAFASESAAGLHAPDAANQVGSRLAS